MNKLARLMLFDDSGATAIEYGFVLGLIVLVIIGAMALVGGNLACIFNGIVDVLLGAGMPICSAAPGP